MVILNVRTVYGCYSILMYQDMFTSNATGTLLPLDGEVMTRYGLVSYHTFAFKPRGLDSYPVLTPAMVGAIGRATAALGRVDALGTNIPNPDLLRRPTIRREAQSTSALEGTYERLETVLAADYEVGESKHGFNETMREVLNYLDAANHGILSVQEGRPISRSLTRELQQLLVAGTSSDGPQAGDVRSTQVFIGANTRRIEDARFVPMPPGQQLDSELNALFDWWAARADPGLMVLDAAMFHYQFETLHPFTDGNGRIGRLLILLQLMRRGMLKQPLLSISPWFERRRSQYQDLLLGVSTNGAWEDWSMFFCQGIEESADDAYDRILELTAIRDKYRTLTSSYGGTTRRLAESLIASPYVSVPAVERRLQVSRSSASNAVRNLVDERVLTPMTDSGSRAVMYVALDVLNAVR